MSEKENKFIFGDNSDGFRRSATGDEAQPFREPPRPKPTAKRRPPQARTAQQRPPQRQAQRPSQRPPQRRNAQPPKKKSPAKGLFNSGRAYAKRNVHIVEDKNLSPNERRRLHDQKRRERQKRKQTLTCIGAAAAVLLIAAVLSLTVFFRVEQITVKGDSPYTEEEVIYFSGIELGENIIRCGAGDASEKLSTSLPYIDSASVKRTLTGKVTITVKTTKAKWSFLNGDQAVLINAEGKVLEVGDPELALKGTVVQGVKIASATTGQIIVFDKENTYNKISSLGKAFEEAGLKNLTSLDLSVSSYIKAFYDGRIMLNIGSTDNIDRKLALAAKVIERENSVDPMQYATLDLTVDGKAYFRTDESQPAIPDDDDEGTTAADSGKTTANKAE